MLLYTATFLINGLPTQTLNHLSPFEWLFHHTPNYKSLRVFSCLCYPWLKPYTSHKLESQSKPCVYLGPLCSQSAYHCYDPVTNKFYKSRYVELWRVYFLLLPYLLSHLSPPQLLLIRSPTFHWTLLALSFLFPLHPFLQFHPNTFLPQLQLYLGTTPS